MVVAFNYNFGNNPFSMENNSLFEPFLGEHDEIITENDNETCKNLIAMGSYVGQYTCPKAFMGSNGSCSCGPGCVEFKVQEGAPSICCSSVLDIRGDRFCVDDIPGEMTSTPGPTGSGGAQGALDSGKLNKVNALNALRALPTKELEKRYKKQSKEDIITEETTDNDETCKNLISTGPYVGKYTCPNATYAGKDHCDCGSGCVEYRANKDSPPVCCTKVIDIRGDKFCVDDAPVGMKSFYDENATEAPLGLSGFDPTDSSMNSADDKDTTRMIEIAQKRTERFTNTSLSSFEIFLIVFFVLLFLYLIRNK
jgi:hypothetical protein